MSLTSMLINRQVPTFPPGLPRYINRPDMKRRPFVNYKVQNDAPENERTNLYECRKIAATASIMESRAKVIKAIKAGAKTKSEIQAKSGLSKSSVFNHTTSMLHDGILMIDKSVSPWEFEVVKWP